MASAATTSTPGTKPTWATNAYSPRNPCSHAAFSVAARSSYIHRAEMARRVGCYPVKAGKNSSFSPQMSCRRLWEPCSLSGLCPPRLQKVLHTQPCLKAPEHNYREHCKAFGLCRQRCCLKLYPLVQGLAVLSMSLPSQTDRDLRFNFCVCKGNISL